MKIRSVHLKSSQGAASRSLETEEGPYQIPTRARRSSVMMLLLQQATSRLGRGAIPPHSPLLPSACYFLVAINITSLLVSFREHAALVRSYNGCRSRSSLFALLNDVSANTVSETEPRLAGKTDASSSSRGRCTCGRYVGISFFRMCGCTRDPGRSCEVSWPPARTPRRLDDFRSRRVGSVHPL